MTLNIHGASCEINTLPGKYVDVTFNDEVQVTAQVIESLINSMYTGDYYALRILTKSENFLETLKHNFGFVNGIYWSNRKAPPLEVVFQQLFPSSSPKTEILNGDIIYHVEDFSSDRYTVPVGFSDGKNILIQEHYSQYRILNPAWGISDNYNEMVEQQFPRSIQDYILKNRLALLSANSLRAGNDSFNLIVNPYTEGITITGPKTLSLTKDLLVCYNGEVNIPYNEHCTFVDNTWKFVSTLFTKSTMFIFTHKQRTYICVSEIPFITEIAKLPQNYPNSYEVVTPLGQTKDGSSITVLNYFLQRSEHQNGNIPQYR